MHEQLQHLQDGQAIYRPDYPKYFDDSSLFDDDLRGPADFWLKLKPHLGPQSALFRHAVRIALVFLVGYAISLLPFAKMATGYC